jgi:hypothetical protein
MYILRSKIYKYIYVYVAGEITFVMKSKMMTATPFQFLACIGHWNIQVYWEAMFEMLSDIYNLQEGSPFSISIK